VGSKQIDCLDIQWNTSLAVSSAFGRVLLNYRTIYLRTALTDSYGGNWTINGIS
jgi:hypothetical protein